MDCLSICSSCFFSGILKQNDHSFVYSLQKATSRCLGDAFHIRHKFEGLKG